MLKMGSSGNCVKNGLKGTIADAEKPVKKQCSQSSRLEVWPAGSKVAAAESAECP